MKGAETRRLRRNRFWTHSATILATGMLASGLATAAQAQDAPPPPASGSDDPASSAADEIIVTGFRASLQNSTNAKRENVGFTDSVSAEDVGKCAYGVFRRGASAAGQRFGIAGDVLSGAEMAEKMGRALGRSVRFEDVPFDVFRGLGFPGADDLGNMFQFQAMLGDEFLRARDPQLSRALNPELLSFDAWLAANARRIPT